jgi:hypothetical protein
MFKVFEVTAALVMYACGALLSTFLFALIASSPLPIRAYLISGVLLVSFWGALVYYIYGRYKYKQSISFYSKHGVTVRLILAVELNQYQKDIINETLDNVISFWSAIYPDQAYQISNSFRGATLTITNEKIPWLDPTGLNRVATGLQVYNDIKVNWSADRTWERVLLTVRHEFSHLALETIGVDSGLAGVLHHKLFAEKGLGC